MKTIYPNDDPPEFEEPPCAICEGSVETCNCPECDECGVVGDPACINTHMPWKKWPALNWESPRFLIEAKKLAEIEKHLFDDLDYPPIKSMAEIIAKAKEIAQDERLDRPPANIQINAPLALIQVELANRLIALNWVLGEDAIDIRLLRYFRKE